MLESTSKTYPLTTIDLANLSARPTGERYRYLRNWSPPRVRISYRPIKDNWSKLIAREPSLELTLSGDDKSALLAQIARECRYGDADHTANISVAEAIWDWAIAKDARSVQHEFEPYRTSLATNRFFESGIILVGGRGFGILLDPRRSSSGLDSGGRAFAFSAMYWRIAGIADYVDVELAIMRISDSATLRRASMFEFTGAPVFSKEEVETRIEETQRIWLDVQLERRARSIQGEFG